MPIIVIKFPIDWLHQSFKGSRPQINDEWDSPIFQCQVDVICWFARVQHQSIPLQGFEWQCDFITAALNRVQGQVVAEELRSFEGCDIFFFSCRDKERKVAALIHWPLGCLVKTCKKKSVRIHGMRIHSVCFHTFLVTSHNGTVLTFILDLFRSYVLQFAAFVQ